jgi:hypothetical protein
MSFIRRGLLSDYFEGVAVKRLSVVETTPSQSNQHEFNGSKQLRQLFGDDDRIGIQTRYVWLGAEQEGIAADSTLSWYDARRNHPSRTEYRLYYYENDVTGLMSAGDTLFIARRPNGAAMVIITPIDSTIQNQLLWLFGLEEQPELQFTVREIPASQAAEVDFAARYILDELGIELEEPEADRLDIMIEKFGLRFPTTREFSALARSSIGNEKMRALEAPDDTLLAWMEREEQLFRRLERHIVSERLKSGFTPAEGVDVDGFLSFSLSVQNRRKSRAGLALENHLEAIFNAQGLCYARGTETENRNKPDFLFPSPAEYKNPEFPASRLTMLGSKSTLKDRWRQVLSEASRIDEKHLMTLEPGISENQTDEMRTKRLQLVLPRRLHDTYRVSQREWLMSLDDFLNLVKQRQIDV